MTLSRGQAYFSDLIIVVIIKDNTYILILKVIFLAKISK